MANGRQIPEQIISALEKGKKIPDEFITAIEFDTSIPEEILELINGDQAISPEKLEYLKEITIQHRRLELLQGLLPAGNGIEVETLRFFCEEKAMFKAAFIQAVGMENEVASIKVDKLYELAESYWRTEFNFPRIDTVCIANEWESPDHVMPPLPVGEQVLMRIPVLF